MEAIQFWLSVAIACVIAYLVLSWVVWPLVKSKWLTKGSTASNVGDKISALVDEGLMLVCLSDCYLLAKKRGDTKIIDLLNQVRLASAQWDDAVPMVSVNPLTPIETIIADAVAKVQEVGK